MVSLYRTLRVADEDNGLPGQSSRVELHPNPLFEMNEYDVKGNRLFREKKYYLM